MPTDHFCLEFTAHSANHHPHARFTDQREKKRMY